jgi:hypothetical protein
METEYKIKLYDNGWTLEDSRSLAKQVVQEKDSDKKHIKIKHLLGEWLYEDMDDFLNESEDIECVIEIKFKKTEEEE